MGVIEYLRDFNLVSIVLRIFLAAIFSGIIGLERDRSGKAAGMRTHVLVCLGAALASLVGIYVTENLGYSSDPTRITAQVISGIGFIGAGAILVRQYTQEITGLTTAAGLWSAAALGISLGVGFYEGAIICFIIILGIFVIPSRFKKTYGSIHIYAEIDDVRNLNQVMEKLYNGFKITNIDIRPPRSSTQGCVGVELMIGLDKGESHRDTVIKLLEDENIVFAYKEHD